MFQKVMIKFCGLGISTILLLFIFAFDSSLADAPLLLPDTVTVEMYELNSNGSITENLCTANSTNYGCTAYEKDPDYSYPFTSSTITINIEDFPLNGFQQGYLHNVTPVEIAITVSSQGNKPLSSVRGQAIAARTFTYYQIEDGATINNSNQFHVYVPYSYQKLTVAQQQRINEAMSEMIYITTSVSTDTIRAHYGQDNDEWTQDGGESYLKSIHDPISAEYGEDSGTSYGGMSSKGVSRWGFGHTSSWGPDNPNRPGSQYPHDSNPDGNGGYGNFWSVRWDDAAQILTHYYTGVHLRDVDDISDRLTPEYRWNLLDISWSEAGCPSVIPVGGSCTGNFYIQNTGTEIWTDGRVTFSHHGWQPVGFRGGEIETASALGQDVAPGSVITIPITLNAPGNASRGDRYLLRFEMWLEDDLGDWLGFSEAEPDRPWPTYDVSVCGELA